MIPTHKCTPYCEPDEGIHCVPDMWEPDKTLEHWRDQFGFQLHGIEVLRVERDDDVVPAMVHCNIAGKPIWRNPSNNTGYLVWMRERPTTKPSTD